MARICFLFLLLYSIVLSAQQESISYCFGYDEAGNQNSVTVCLNPNNLSHKKKTSELVENKGEDKKDGFHLTEINNRKDEISNSSGIGNIIEKSIVVAPNPVHDILTVKWNHYDENPLIRISLVTNDMRILFENTKVESSKRTETLYFTSYPPGIYYLVGYFYDGTKKTIKIIKN